MADRASRALDYVFGRNVLIGVAALMLLLISGYATWHGMSDFILGFQASGQAAGVEPRSIGGLPVTTEALIVAITIALTFLMWLALRETFGARRALSARLVTLPLYLFLALWSVGFGYGFWWSLIAGPVSTQEGLQRQVEEARIAVGQVRDRVEAVSGSLSFAVQLSDARMEVEETRGGSCGVASGTGRGPLYRARSRVRDTVSSLQAGIAENWLDPVRSTIVSLDAQAGEIIAGIEGATVAERSARFRAATTEIRLSIEDIASRSNTQGASFASRLEQLAASLEIPPGSPGFSCYDPDLAAALRAAAEQAQQPVVVSLPEAAFSEGAAGVANAVLALWENLGAYFAAIGDWWSAPPAQSETEEVAKTATGEPITGRDLIALLAALGVDLGLFALTVLNPPTAAPARRDSLDDALQRLHEPSEVSIREIAEIIRTSLMVAPDTSLEWVRKHFFSHLGYSYFVIPNLADCDAEGQGGNRALAINQLAGVLTKMQLVQALDRPKRGYGRHLQRGLGRFSMEGRWREAMDAASRRIPSGEDAEQDFEYTRSHAWTAWLTSTVERRVWRPEFIAKAAKALEIAGWSEDERRRPEVYFVYHREGLEPILTVLERGEGADVRDAAPA